MVVVKFMDFDKVFELFEFVFGFEVYVEFNMNMKMFFDVLNFVNEVYYVVELNMLIVLVDLGFFGVLFVVNEMVICLLISLGFVFGCLIVLLSWFVCKNYFYLDLGKNY